MEREIVSVAIHPAIGVARVGNSLKEHFLASEIPGQPPRDANDFRDSEGHIKRQAVRFRLFGFDSEGNVVGEITAGEAEITWRVHVANKKAAWYHFNQALDIPASQQVPADANMGVVGQPLASFLRNYSVLNRQELAIDPGAREISGTNTNADGNNDRFRFNTGTFQGVQVNLGELRTDESGRLLFLGGFGRAISPSGAHLVTFANNDGWCDDVSDGSVDATVKIGNRTLKAEGAWVITAPPDFAPGIASVVTGYDLLLSVAYEPDSNLKSLKPKRPSFREHIYPLLWRMSQTQWVNAGFARDFGWKSRYDFHDPAFIKQLADPTEASWSLRHSIASQFRDASYTQMQINKWPAYYGDALLLKQDSADPREWMAILPIQAEWIARWACGEFNDDWGDVPSDGITPQGLDQAALEWTLGGPFHPGCEFTWPMRHARMYSAPFRIKRRTAPEPSYGDVISPREALADGGPLDGSLPGDITRWMAVPWLTDTSSCLSAYVEYFGDYLPTFWPARVPNDVLTQENYDKVRDTALPLSQRQQAFDYTARKRWLRDIVFPDKEGWLTRISNVEERLDLFIKEWHKTGILVEKDGPSDEPRLFPEKVWVETGRTVKPLKTGGTAKPLKGKKPLPDGEAVIQLHNPITKRMKKR